MGASTRPAGSIRGLDSAETKALLWDEYAILPSMDTRELRREEKQNPDYDPS